LERRFTHAAIEEMLRQSVHPPELLAQMTFAGGPLLSPDQSLCLYCHDEPIFRDPQGLIPALNLASGRTFDRCDVCHAEQIPIDVLYSLRHVSARLQTARPTLEMAQVCAVCHSDASVLRTYAMHDTVASFVRSFHGKAALLGDLTTASCVSCHVASGANAHLMLGPQNPDSAVHPRRVADSCRSVACHPGASKSLAAAGVHLDLPTDVGKVEYVLAVLFIVLTVVTFGPSMLIVVLELFGLVIGREHHGAESLRRLAATLWENPAGRRRLTRFSVNQRFQHWVLALLFATLALTGFPMKFADREWARVVIDACGGLSVARQVHHWAGVALMVGFAAHLLAAVRTALRNMQRTRHTGAPASFIRSFAALPMWIGWTDAKKMFQLMGYLVHLREHPPAFGRFTVKEKFEYIGVFWGTTLLGLTGAILWGEQYATRWIGGRALNLALIAHTYEAFLAIIHVGILHIINVMLKPNVFPLSLATITGRTPLVELADEHSEQVLEVARELGVAVEGVAAHA